MSKIKLEIHHGGRLQLSPTIAYIGGKKDIYENFDPDSITVTDIAAFIIKECGYSNYSTIWYKFEVDDFSDIFVFEKDKDVMKILNTLQNNDCKVLQLFVEHEVDEEPEVVATASSTAPSLLTLTPQSQINDDIGEGQSHRMDDAAHQERTTNTGAIDPDKVDLTGCEFLDSDAEQPDLFFEDGGKGKRVPQDNGGEQRDGVAEQSGEASSILLPQYNDAYVSGWDGEAHSEYDDSDELVSLDGSSDDEANKRPRFKSFNEVTDFKKPINLEVGLKFANHQIYRQALKQYCIENGIVFKYKKNENKRITVICKKNCGWRIHAAKTHDGEAFQVKTFKGKDHNCGWEKDNRWVTSKWLAEKFVDNIKDTPDWSNTVFKNQVLRDHNVEVSRHQTYRVKRKAKKQVEGSHTEQFSKLWGYCAIIRKTNPGSTMKLKLENSCFQRMYCCLDPCKKGFLSACRPIICVDGCFLKGSFGGQLLTVVSKDGNENMYPIAYAGLQQVLESIGCDHRVCVRHLYANFKKLHKGKSLKDGLWNVCRATTMHIFKHHMSVLKSLHVDAHNWLTKYPANTWSKHTFSPRTKCDILQNNIAETFNSFILDARDKPIITMFEMIRGLLMQRFVAKKEGMENYRGPICPRIETKLERAKLESRNYIFYATGDGRFEVESPWKREVVDLNSRTCTCKCWDLTGIPCRHGVAAVYKMRRTLEEYVDLYYSTSTFLNAYSTTIGPVPGEEYWPPTNCNQILPPEYKTASGRPKKARKRAEDEPQNPFTNINTRKGVTTKCKNCGKPGHNYRSCKGPANPNRKIYKKKKKSKSTGEPSTEKKITTHPPN
ncbi:uncharacterized protein G2W53_026264 [Senna tora]|uniref:SWIM-type domain-containing protein n=1 Tax=Senna tora TaxID=362788 RepID=A0A834TGW0_9FABA|nr:uncharacterized protein G2W53_026264 [Senna tora]